MSGKIGRTYEQMKMEDDIWRFPPISQNPAVLTPPGVHKRV